MSDFYVAGKAYLADGDSVALYQHPQLDGVCLKPITSKTQFDMAEGLMFFRSNGDIAFGFIGRSLRRFRNNPVKRVHNGSNGSRAVTMNVPTTPAGYVRVSNDVVNSIYGLHPAQLGETFTRHTSKLSWNEEQCRASVEYDSNVYHAMEIIVYNADDGEFAYGSKMGGGHYENQDRVTDEAERTIGWIAKRISIGPCGPGIQYAYPSMVEGMKRDEKKYFDRAYHSFQQGPGSKQELYANVVTAFKYEPSSMTSSAVTGISSTRLETFAGYYLVDIGADTSNMFLIPEVIQCGDPQGMTIVSDIGSGHRLLKAINFFDGSFNRVIATGTPMDQALAIAGEAYSNGTPPTPTSYVPFPPNIDTSGLSEEEIARGWMVVDTSQASKSQVAHVCRKAFGIQAFPQLQDIITGIYDTAINLAKKDAKKR